MDEGFRGLSGGESALQSITSHLNLVYSFSWLSLNYAINARKYEVWESGVFIKSSKIILKIHADDVDVSKRLGAVMTV